MMMMMMMATAYNIMFDDAAQESLKIEWVLISSAAAAVAERR
jgi:hypothetical protein